jgi:glutaminyl-tRNA synthetase
VQGVIHWVSAQHCLPAQARLYDRLFSIEDPGSEAEDFTKYLNPSSLEILTTCYAEQNLKSAKAGGRYQFERLGYFCVDVDTVAGKPVFNRIVPLRDSWIKVNKD